MRDRVEQAIRTERLVAILRGVPEEHAAALGEVLLESGLRLMEVALSTSDALEVLQRLRNAIGARGFVGAGSVVTADLGRKALDAGAEFFVTPHVVREVCEFALSQNVAVTCGALTPTEIAQARSLGSRIVKLFPASSLGAGYVKALKGPYPDLELLAVGGVGPGNLAEFFRAGAVGAGIGGALTEQNWSRPDFNQVAHIAANLVQITGEATRAAHC